MSGILGKEGAIRHLADSSRLGSLPSILMEQISTATACKRGGVLTRRTLYRWMTNTNLPGGRVQRRSSYRAAPHSPRKMGLFSASKANQ